MFFKKKANDIKCLECKGNFSAKYNYCPFCGASRMNIDDQDSGMLGKRDMSDEEFSGNTISNNNLNAMDKMIASLMNNMMKNMFSELEKADIKKTPSGIKIRIGMPGAPQRNPIKEQKQKTKILSEEQIKRISSLPREKAKTSVKRINDKIIYEIEAPGINSPENIFVSRLESGYEVKAIGEDRVYVNSLPVTLPIKSFTINPDKLLIEFVTKDL
jgi:hypothetical protein